MPLPGGASGAERCGGAAAQVHLFTVEETLRYVPFYTDFGPLNLGCLFRYCRLVADKLKVSAGCAPCRRPRARRRVLGSCAAIAMCDSGGQDAALRNHRLVHYVSVAPPAGRNYDKCEEKRANAAYLIASFAVGALPLPRARRAR